MEKTKTKVRFDKWFLVVLGIILWTLCSQAVNLALVLPGSWANFNLWCRLIACCIAIYGDVWVFRMYISNTKRQARRNEQIGKAIKEHPELKSIINDIMGR